MEMEFCDFQKLWCPFLCIFVQNMSQDIKMHRDLWKNDKNML